VTASAEWCDPDAGRGRVMPAREDVLRWGLVDWVELDRIHSSVLRETAVQPLAVVLIRLLASESSAQMSGYDWAMMALQTVSS
jgi:hypothetical protein